MRKRPQLLLDCRSIKEVSYFFEYARIVKDKALKRNLISKLAQLEAEVNSDRGASSEDLLDRVQSEFLKMGLGKNKEASSPDKSVDWHSCKSHRALKAVQLNGKPPDWLKEHPISMFSFLRVRRKR